MFYRALMGIKKSPKRGIQTQPFKLYKTWDQDLGPSSSGLSSELQLQHFL
jgi:hypothetical protein